MKLYTNQLIRTLEQLNQGRRLLEGTKNSLGLGELLESSKALAAVLLNKGMQYGDRVVIASEPGVDFVKIMFATMMLDCTVAIIDPDMGRDNYRNKLDQFKPQWVFLDSRIMLLQEHPILRMIYFWWKKEGIYFPMNRNIKKILTGPRLPILQKHYSLKKLTAKTADKEYTMEYKDDQEYLVTYTSGTTKEPKGVLHTISGLFRSIQLISEIIQSEEEQTLATYLPHFMLIGACAGVKVRLWKKEMSPQEKLKFITQFGITTLFGPPVEIFELVNYCKTQNTMLPSTLTHVILGSAPVHQTFLKQLIPFLPEKTKITCLYGMTENLVVCTIDGRTKVLANTEGDLLGKPAKGVEIKISDDDEIMIRSKQLHSRYWHKEHRTEWHATGDLGKLDTNGNLILTGRKKDMIIRRDFNLYPGLYEPTVKKIPGIEEAIFIGKYDESIADEIVYLFIEKKNQMSKKQLLKKLIHGEYSIDKEALPDEIEFKKIPRIGRQQKVDRKTLRKAVSVLSKFSR